MQRRGERPPVAREERVHGVEPRDGGRRRHARGQAAQRRWRHAELVEEEVHGEQPRPERGHRDAADAEQAAHVVHRPVAVDGGDHAERDADRDRDEHAGERQLERGGHALQEVGENGPTRRGALAEVGAEHPGEIAPVLHRHRPIEPHLALHLLDVLGRRERPRLDERRVARQQVGQGERDQRDAEERREHEQHAGRDVAAEAHGQAAAPARGVRRGRLEDAGAVAGPREPWRALSRASRRGSARTCPTASRTR